MRFYLLAFLALISIASARGCDREYWTHCGGWWGVPDCPSGWRVNEECCGGVFCSDKRGRCREEWQCPDNHTCGGSENICDPMYSCSTGGGSNCKTCKGVTELAYDNDCATCDDGWQKKSGSDGGCMLNPTQSPTPRPTFSPTDPPTKEPTKKPTTPQPTMNPTEEPDKYWIDDGCHADSSPADDFTGMWSQDVEARYGVRCCSADNCITPVQCKANVEGKNLAEAIAICQEKDMELCTKDQLLSDMCCGKGGNCDNHVVWTSTLKQTYTPVVERYWVDDGCEIESGKRDDVVGAYQDETQMHGVRCCSEDTCVAGFKCTAGGKTFTQAKSICRSKGMEVCTKAQLNSQMCCGTGGNCDNKSVWTSTKEMPAMPTVAPTEIEYWADEACETERGTKDDIEGAFVGMSAKYGVRCCTETECTPAHPCRGDGMDFMQAMQMCAQEGKFLCSRDQLQSQMCCGTGGQCDNAAVWSSTPKIEEMKYYVDDGCHSESGKSDDYAGAYYGASHMFGVRCCGENKCVTRADCDGESGMTYSEAEAICDREGLHVCTKDELMSDMCCGKGGNCDNNQVWTSTVMGSEPCEFEQIFTDGNIRWGQYISWHNGADAKTQEECEAMCSGTMAYEVKQSGTGLAEGEECTHIRYDGSNCVLFKSAEQSAPNYKGPPNNGNLLKKNCPYVQ